MHDPGKSIINLSASHTSIVETVLVMLTIKMATNISQKSQHHLAVLHRRQ